MESGTRAIVELAWARVLGLPDDALETDEGIRLTMVDHTVAMFVRLWEHRVLVGPAWLLDRAVDVGDEELARGAGLLGLTAEAPGGGRPGQLVGAALLSFTDAYVEDDRLESAPVSDDPRTVADLERACPPDDVTEVGLSSMAQQLVLLDDREAPVAGAGYAEQQGILAQLGVLTPPALRREGHGTLVAALALNDALDEGLVAQWRHRPENAASSALARRLGFETVGSQTTVLLPSGPAPA